MSVILPFDTLLMPMSPSLRKQIAQVYSSQWDTYRTTGSSNKTAPRSHRRLRIGYLSYDFNDHPTSHLIQGLFTHHNTRLFMILAFAYGKGMWLI